MGLIKEPIDIDFFVDPRPLTISENRMISEFISRDKQLRKVKINKKQKSINLL